jgi:hypothetical protein
MIITIVGSSLVSVVSLHMGAAFVGFVLGKGNSLDSGAVKGPDYALGLLPGEHGFASDRTRMIRESKGSPENPCYEREYDERLKFSSIFLFNTVKILIAA